jgi:hypothetical protein
VYQGARQGTRPSAWGFTVAVVNDQSLVTYVLSWSGLVLESRGRECGSPWRLIDPEMSAAEIADLKWESPAGRLWVSWRGAYLQIPHPEAGIQCWLLTGDRTAEPVTVMCREPDSDRCVEVVDIGGAWAAQWLGPPAECVITRAGHTEQMSFHSRTRYVTGGSTWPGWVGRRTRWK